MRDRHSAMDYKPVHVITNYPVDLWKRAVRFYHVEVVTGCEDHDGSEFHCHYLVHWPVRRKPSGRTELKPSKTTFVRGARRLITPRCSCYNRAHNTPCEQCGFYFKLNWCEDDEHAKNTFEYIEGKLILQPNWRLYGQQH